MRPSAVFRLTLPVSLAIIFVSASFANAQDAPPPFPRVVVDLRVSVLKFPGDFEVAAARQLDQRELPGVGLGIDGGAQLYLFKWGAVTVGGGLQLTLARSRSSPLAAAGEAPLRSVTERFSAVAPQLSLNFGTGDGWSYLSGGIGRSAWSIVPDKGTARPADRERLYTINYGGGARWFLTPHMAFTFDARFYARAPGTPHLDAPGTPRTTLLLMGAGISVK